jgi:hypothetical protein
LLLSSGIDFDPIESLEEFKNSVFSRSLDFVGWEEFNPGKSNRKYYKAQIRDVFVNNRDLENPLFEFEESTLNELSERDIRRGDTKLDSFIFIAEFEIEKNINQPKSTLAEVWNECLGPRGIPFDPEARQALIEHGRQHPELRRHIEAWEEMERTNSKWVNIYDEDKSVS